MLSRQKTGLWFVDLYAYIWWGLFWWKALELISLLGAQIKWTLAKHFKFSICRGKPGHSLGLLSTSKTVVLGTIWHHHYCHHANHLVSCWTWNRPNKLSNKITQNLTYNHLNMTQKTNLVLLMYAVTTCCVGFIRIFIICTLFFM